MRQLRLGTLVVVAFAVVTAIAASAAYAEEGFLPTTNFVGTGGSSTTKALGGLELTCKALSILGSMTNDKSGTANLHFSGCKALGFPENSLGDSSGVVLVPSFWELCLRNPTTLEFGITFAPMAAVHSEIPLAGVLEITFGLVIGTIKPNARGRVKTIQLTSTNGDPAITACGGKEATMTIEQNENGKKEMAGISGEATIEAENKTTEIELMDT
jgi:hypothetical protein